MCRAAGRVYEFGVYTGRAMRAMAKWSVLKSLPVRRFWGFDSFEGISRDAPPRTPNSSYSASFSVGDFSVARVLAGHGIVRASPLKVVREYINDSRVELIGGYFEQSLTRRLAERRGMRPAMYVDVDCDIYSAALAALSWMLEHKLIVAGTVIGYDDWGYGMKGALQKLPGRGNYRLRPGVPLEGEPRAHKEIAARYNISFSPLERTIQSGARAGVFESGWSSGQAIFRVDAIGGV